MITVIRDPTPCNKCKKLIMPTERAEKVYLDFEKDITVYYHVMCLRGITKPAEPQKDKNQMELI